MPDMTLTDFMTHLAGAAMEIKAGRKEAMEHACRVVEAEAKRVLGTYQNAAGGLVGWAELAEATQEQRVALGYTENDPGLRSGAMRDSIGHVAAEREGVVGSNNEHLVYFEVGTSKQPPRPTLALAAVHKGERVAEILRGGVIKTLIGRGVVEGGLSLNGE